MTEFMKHVLPMLRSPFRPRFSLEEDPCFGDDDTSSESVVDEDSRDGLGVEVVPYFRSVDDVVEEVEEDPRYFEDL